MSHSMKISDLNKIHFSLDPLKERSTEYHHVTDLVAEQRAFWQKKNRHGDWAWPLPQFSSQTGVSKTRGRGRGLFFLENAVLWLGLFRDRVRFRFRIRVRVRVRVSVNPNPNPKTAFFKKKIDPNPSFY